MSWVDYALLAILALSAWGGLVQGFFRSALGVVVVGLGMFAAFKYYRPVGDYLDRRYDLGAGLENLISGWLGGAGPAVAPDVLPGTAARDFEGFSGLLDQFLAGQLDGLGQAVTWALAPAALSVVSFLAVFILAAWLGGLVLSRIPRLPLLGPIDRAGGFVFGLARGFVYGLIALMAVKFLSFSGAVFGGNTLAAGLDGSQLAPAYFSFLHYLWALFTPFSR